MKHSEVALHQYNELMQNDAVSPDIKQTLTMTFAPMLREKRAVRDRLSIQSILERE